MGLQNIQEFRDKKTLIVGEVNTGKTVLTARILKRFIDEGEKDLTVIDMAPQAVKGIGGKMNAASIYAVRYYTTEIKAPRLMGKTVDETEMLAERNAGLIDKIFRAYMKAPGKVLVINDVSLYLQAGKLDKLLSFLKSTLTIVMNGYYGFSLGGGELGKREREQMKELQNMCDKVIHTPAEGF